MFTTKVWDKKGLTIAMGPPGTENHFLGDHIIKEAKMVGLSTKKSFNRLNHGEILQQEPQIVSLKKLQCKKHIKTLILDCNGIDEQD